MLVLSRASNEGFNIKVTSPCEFDIKVRHFVSEQHRDMIDVVFDCPSEVRVKRLELLNREFGEKKQDT